MKANITCSVVGARGYAGLETARLLLAHPCAKLTHCFATSEFRLPFVSAKEVSCLQDSEIMNHLTDVVFLATPAEVSMKLAPEILAQGKKVIDLSGAFRLHKDDYPKWYGFEHTQAALLKKAVYGLLPWTKAYKGETLIANPGCYATAISLALAPLLKENLIDPSHIVIDAKSGATGAGKKAAENLLFTEVDGGCLPYKVGRHQHLPEILQTLKNLTGHKLEVHLTTSLLPARRGIIAGIYADLHEGVSIKDVRSAFAKRYDSYELISYGAAEDEPGLLQLKNVVGTGKTHISFSAQGRKLYVFSCLDNLLKGAASQAVENFNRISDLPIHMGVGHLEVIT